MNEQHSAKSGQFVSKEEAKQNPGTTVRVEEDRRSVWLKEWIRQGEQIEQTAKEIQGSDAEQGINFLYTLDSLTVQAMQHVQILKRVDQGN